MNFFPYGGVVSLSYVQLKYGGKIYPDEEKKRKKKEKIASIGVFDNAQKQHILSLYNAIF